jgi:hypothetical protein
MTGAACVLQFPSNFEISFHSRNEILQLRYGRLSELLPLKQKFHFNPTAGYSSYDGNWYTEMCSQASFGRYTSTQLTDKPTK